MFVYVIRGSNGLYKIGRTIDLPQRLAGLKTELWHKWGVESFELVLSFETADARALEHALHDHFVGMRRAGEWFALTDDDLAALTTEPLPQPKKKRQYRKPPTFLKQAEREEFLSIVTDVRDRAIVMTFLFGGLRLNELVMLDRVDMDFTYRTIHIRHAKGGKERTVGLHRLTEEAVRAYLASRRDPNPALFISNRRRRMHWRSVQHMIEKYVARCSFSAYKHVTTHCLRHTFATSLMKATGRDIQIVQRALGHANIATTSIYAHLDDDVLYQAMDKL